MTTPRKTSRNVTPETPFSPVFHKNGHRIAGLWQRGNRFYAQLRIKEAGRTRPTRRPLKADTLTKAVEELAELKVNRNKGELKLSGHAPKLVDAIASYKESAEYLGKRPGTRVCEDGYFKRWIARLGSKKVSDITAAEIIAVRDELHKDGKHVRTCNLYVGALKQVLRYCHHRGQLSRLPEVKRLKQPKTPRRDDQYLSDEQIAQLLANCRPEVNKNAEQMKLFLRFLLLTGAREQEATRVRWSDVHLDRRIVTIGADGLSKNHEARDVDMTDDLVELLTEMKASREELLAETEAGKDEERQWLFPSPQRVNRELRVRNFRACLNDIRGTPRENRRREPVELEHKFPHVGFHTFRHTFISKCVEAGIDFMTIAAWVGHKDGGILIGRVYGHLSKTHKAHMAQRLTLIKKPDNVVELPQAQAAG
jgi:integrase